MCLNFDAIELIVIHFGGLKFRSDRIGLWCEMLIIITTPKIVVVVTLLLTHHTHTILRIPTHY